MYGDPAFGHGALLHGQTIAHQCTEIHGSPLLRFPAIDIMTLNMQDLFDPCDDLRLFDHGPAEVCFITLLSLAHTLYKSGDSPRLCLAQRGSQRSLFRPEELRQFLQVVRLAVLLKTPY